MSSDGLGKSDAFQKLLTITETRNQPRFRTGM